MTNEVRQSDRTKTAVTEPDAHQAQPDAPCPEIPLASADTVVAGSERTPGPAAKSRGGAAPARAVSFTLSGQFRRTDAVLLLATAGFFMCASLTPLPGVATKATAAIAAALFVAMAVLQRRSDRESAVLEEELRRSQQLAKLNSAVISSFAMAIDAKDQHTHGHTERVRDVARAIGREMNVSADELQALETAAMLHDIGKLAVPDYILSKPDRLTQEEMKKVQTHTLVGAAILEPVQFPWPVIPTIRSHHEWYDGTGYPDGLAGEQVPLGARILAVADVYDALLSHRPYRPAMAVPEAVAFMRERAGTQFDPRVLNVCFRVLAARQADNQFGFIFDANSTGRAPQETPGRRAIYMDIKQAHQELFALYEIVQTMGQSLNVRETLDLIISKTKPIVDFAACAVFLRQPEEEDPAGAAITGVAALGPHADIIIGSRIPLGRGVSGAVAESGRPSGLGRPAESDMAFLLGPSAGKSALAHALSAPLGNESESIGAITLYRTADQPFDEDDARLLTALARQATVAVNNARQYEQTRQSALTDQLTGLANARYFFLSLDQELGRARREKTPLSLVAIDLNNLKYLNDTFGHQQGDRALRILAEVFRRHVREFDTVVRYAGDEFFIILPDTANQTAVETANRIKRAVRETQLRVGDHVLPLSASFGVATFPGDAKEADGLISVADRAMYADKRLSRQAALLSSSQEATISPR